MRIPRPTPPWTCPLSARVRRLLIVNLAGRRDYTDATLIAAVLAIAFGGVWAELHYSPSSTPSPIGGYALTLGAAASLVLRLRRPIPAAALCLALCYLYRASGYPGFAPGILIFVFCYTLANRRGLAFGLAPAVLAWAVPALPPHALSLTDFAVAMPPVGMALVALVGEANRRRRIEYEARVRESAATAEARMGRRIAQERLRIARELHDVLAHTISVVAVQSGVALDALGDSPEEARQALIAVRGAAKQALPELRAALELLRGEGEFDDAGEGLSGDTDGNTRPQPAPQPGLARLPDLVCQALESGFDTELEVGPDLDSASPLLQLTAYRIVQEALTNVRKHAPAAHTRVTLRRENGLMSVDVLDDGRGASADLAAAGRGGPAGPGFGLRGMRERAESLGGRLEAGPRVEGGFAVRARLPWAAATESATAPPPASNGAP